MGTKLTSSMASCSGFPAAWATAMGNCSIISLANVDAGPFVILLLLIIVLLLIVVALFVMEVLLLLDVVQLLIEVFGDVGIELLFVMFNEVLLFKLLLVEFKWLLLLQVLLLPESWKEFVIANGGEDAVCDASDDVEVVRSLTKVPSGRTNICFVPIICKKKENNKRIKRY